MTMYTISSMGYCTPSVGSNGMAAAGDVQSWIIDHGPVSIAVAAGDDWDNYQMGHVLTAQTGPDDVNHAVITIGWQTVPAGTKILRTSKVKGQHNLADEPTKVPEGWKKLKGKRGWHVIPPPEEYTTTTVTIQWLVQNSWDGWGGTTTANDGTCWIQDGCDSVNTEAYGVIVGAVPPPPLPPGPPVPPTPPVNGTSTMTLNGTLSAGTYHVTTGGLFSPKVTMTVAADLPAGTYTLTLPTSKPAVVTTQEPPLAIPPVIESSPCPGGVCPMVRRPLLFPKLRGYR
jgi:hypothetical protein